MNPWLILLAVLVGCGTLAFTVFIAILTSYLLKRIEKQDQFRS
jgi:hypothetical protein